MIHYLLLSKKKILICDRAEHKLNASSLQILWEKAVFQEGIWLKQGCFWANQNCSSLWLQELYFKNFTGPASASLPSGRLAAPTLLALTARPSATSTTPKLNRAGEKNALLYEAIPPASFLRIVHWCGITSDVVLSWLQSQSSRCNTEFTFSKHNTAVRLPPICRSASTVPCKWCRDVIF